MVGGIIFDDFAASSGVKNHVERQAISSHFLVSMIRDPKSVWLDCLSKIFDVHLPTLANLS